MFTRYFLIQTPAVTDHTAEPSATEATPAAEPAKDDAKDEVKEDDKPVSRYSILSVIVANFLFRPKLPPRRRIGPRVRPSSPNFWDLSRTGGPRSRRR